MNMLWYIEMLQVLESIFHHRCHLVVEVSLRLWLEVQGRRYIFARASGGCPPWLNHEPGPCHLGLVHAECPYGNAVDNPSPSVCRRASSSPTQPDHSCA